MGDYLRWKQPRHVKQEMHLLASDLRQRSTNSEALLWDKLRNRQLHGRKFRRQVPIGAYVVDFYCAEEQLVIEIDGGVHANQQEQDKLRQETLEAVGIRFVRLSVEQVESNLADSLRIIQEMFRTYVGCQPPLPSPRLHGRGAGVRVFYQNNNVHYQQRPPLSPLA